MQATTTVYQCGAFLIVLRRSMKHLHNNLDLAFAKPTSLNPSKTNMDPDQRKIFPVRLHSANMRFLATVRSNVSDQAKTSIQLSTTDETSKKPRNIELSIEQFEKLYNVLKEAKNEKSTSR